MDRPDGLDRDHDRAISPRAGRGHATNALDVGVVTHDGCCHCHPYGGSGFDRRQEPDICGYFRNVDDRDPTQSGRDFLEHLQPFSAERGLKIVEPGLA